MKTPAEWLKEIHHLSDTEVRHGSTVILLESDIERIREEAYQQGYEDGSAETAYQIATYPRDSTI